MPRWPVAAVAGGAVTGCEGMAPDAGSAPLMTP
jgi:hypothetical protein